MMTIAPYALVAIGLSVFAQPSKVVTMVTHEWTDRGNIYVEPYNIPTLVLEPANGVAKATRPHEIIRCTIIDTPPGQYARAFAEFDCDGARFLLKGAIFGEPFDDGYEE